MQTQPTKTLLLHSFFLLSLSLSAFSLQLQTLVLNPLPQPHADLKWLEPESHQQHPTLGEDDDDDSVTLQLHHFDTLASPNATAEDLFSLRLTRDALRVHHLSSLAASAGHPRTAPHRHRPRPRPRGSGFSSSIVSGLSQGSGEYFTRLGFGTPPRYMYMVLDTGSDVVWIQCKPCRKCYSQTDPVFNPRTSRSFMPIPCGSLLCRKLDQPGCFSRANRCAYEVSYGDGSITFGEFALETMSFKGMKVPRVAFGCGHDNEGLFVGAAGLFGLGRGKMSFPTQAGRRFGQKFSYCLVDRSASAKPSWVMFGPSSVSRLAVFTPLLTNPKLDTFYYVELVGISVGGTRVPGIKGELFGIDRKGNGGVIVDSGTSVTRLALPAYTALRDAFRAGATGLKAADGFSLFDTCYDLSGRTEVKVPTVVMHFKGADVPLPASNYLIAVDTSGRFCFAFAGTMSGLSIIGNIQQQGFRVVYDVAGGRVGFAPRSC